MRTSIFYDEEEKLKIFIHNFGHSTSQSKQLCCVSINDMSFYMSKEQFIGLQKVIANHKTSEVEV